uniref:hypothetical protein n=1 Tax=Lithothamnion corallioides TaxID=1277934 RepID=UPI0023EF66B5|nr:hypothetical protein P6G75_pgp038 [Lithothamnion corallioides]WEA77125.1 hypothetical protein [Lithothamnion corallioides]
MSLLVIGSTGTLGRQVVRKALDEGFQVKCFVRNFRKAAFLKEWGAELIYGDLKVLQTIPVTLYGITAIIDASTARVSDFYTANRIDLDSKKILIKAAKLAKIKRYIFFSIFDARNYSNIPLMNLKVRVEEELINSDLDYTIFSLCGFFQGLISQYALPILDQQSVWTTKESTSIPYIDTQDVAKFAIRSLSIQATKNRTFILAGKDSWTSFEIIELCEKLSGQKSRISTIPIFTLQFMRKFTKFFQWSWNISERLAFTNMLIEKQSFDISMDEVYSIFHINASEINSLENYLEEYFSRILKKMKELSEQNKNISYIDNF